MWARKSPFRQKSIHRLRVSKLYKTICLPEFVSYLPGFVFYYRQLCWIWSSKFLYAVIHVHCSKVPAGFAGRYNSESPTVIGNHNKILFFCK